MMMSRFVYIITYEGRIQPEKKKHSTHAMVLNRQTSFFKSQHLHVHALMKKKVA